MRSSRRDEGGHLDPIQALRYEYAGAASRGCYFFDPDQLHQKDLLLFCYCTPYRLSDKLTPVQERNPGEPC
jgi:hypothetical protein